ncbi:hypothetical protein ES703_112200 [subsurface metagenome]
MQRMNTDKQSIIIAIDQFYAFLNFPIHFNFLETSKSAYTMIDMHNEVSWFQII